MIHYVEGSLVDWTDWNVTVVVISTVLKSISGTINGLTQ